MHEIRASGVGSCDAQERTFGGVLHTKAATVTCRAAKFCTNTSGTGICLEGLAFDRHNYFFSHIP